MNAKKPKILNDFLIYLSSKNYSEGTIQGYCFDLLIFFNFIIYYFNLKIKIEDINVFVLANIREQDLLAFLTYLCNTKENSFKTRQRKISVVKKFYNWLFTNYSMFKDKINPAKHLPYIEPTLRLPKYLKLDEGIKIQKIYNISNSKYYKRNNTILSLFLNTGLRLSELANIRIKDINFEEKLIKIIGKGNKERTVYLNNKITKMIKEYLGTRKIINLDEALFVNNKNTKLSRRSIANICTKAFELAGLKERNYTTHTLRHTAATYIYKATKDILAVKEVLGHERIVTTMIYTHVENEDLKKAVERNPLNNFQMEKDSVGERGAIK